MTLELLRWSKPSSRSLLIVNKGPGAVSIPHEPERSWDSLEIYFDPAQVASEAPRSPADYVVADADRKLRKCGVLAKLFAARPELLASYDRFLIADDDVSPVGCRIAAVFELFAALHNSTGVRIAQPALTQDSYFTHSVTRVVPGLDWRRTSFVEIMTPILSREALAEYLPLFGETVMTWGLDSLWSAREFREGRPLLIFDATPFRHGRAIGTSVAYEGLAMHPFDEAEAFKRRHNVTHREGLSLGGATADGTWTTVRRCQPPRDSGLASCESPPAFRYRVPGRGEGLVCDAHVQHVRAIAEGAGLAVQAHRFEPEELEEMRDPRLPREPAAVQAGRLGTVYSEKWLRGHADSRAEFHAIAETLHEQLRPFETVVDVGCGASLILERLAELGHEVRGFDGSPHARAVAPEPIRDAITIADLAEVAPGELAGGHRFDLVVCTEVGEHLDPALADHLVAVLVELARDSIYFTAARPGQGGTDHVNEQLPIYWIRKFEAGGFVYQRDRTELVCAGLRERVRQMPWYERSSMVFRRETHV
jgi:SAM-dependent methyltransferase